MSAASPDSESTISNGLDDMVAAQSPAENRNTHQNDELSAEQVHGLWISTVKEQIKKAMASRRPEIPKYSDDNEASGTDLVSSGVAIDSDTSPLLDSNKRRKRERATLVELVDTSFQMPDMVMHHAMKFQKANPGCKFPLTERLRGWVIERKRRANGRFDKYYNHTRSYRRFRSAVEVSNFILREICPNKPVPKSGERSSSRWPGKRRSPEYVVIYDDADKDDEIAATTTDTVHGITSEHKRRVEEFLAESWRNWLNGTTSDHSLEEWSDVHGDDNPIIAKEAEEEMEEQFSAAWQCKKSRGGKRKRRCFQDKDGEEPGNTIEADQEQRVGLASGLLVPEKVYKDLLESFPDDDQPDDDPFINLEDQMDLINYIPTCDE